MAKLTLTPNTRTLVRGYFLDTINSLNNEIVEANTEKRLYSPGTVGKRMENIKLKLFAELDELTKDVSL